MSVAELVQRIKAEMHKAVIGQDDVIDQILVAVLADGHVLLEGVPGIAKTLTVRSLARTLAVSSSRIQFTPDLMPSDVIGTNVFDQRTTEFRLRQGPIFTNFLIADEINRTPPKTQSALLEAMEERQATIDGVRYALPDPFLVFATQNPIEFEGTYPLPEAQQDRFLLKVILQYPAPNVEVEVYRRVHQGFRSANLDSAQLQPVADVAALNAAKAEVQKVVIEDRVFEYIRQMVAATRSHSDILVGASPRAGIALVLGSKALAAIRGRDFVIPDDIKDLALPVLRHRVLLRPETEIEGMTVDRLLTGLVESMTVPR